MGLQLLKNVKTKLRHAGETTVSRSQMQVRLSTTMKRPALVGEKVEDVAQHAAVRLVDLGVFAPGAGDRRESLRLDVEDLGQKPTRCPELADVVRGVTTLHTSEIQALHRFSLSV